GIIAQHAIDENPYWLKLHQAMSIPHSDLPFPNIKIGAFNPNGVLPVTRTDHNNSTYSLNKPQVIFDKAKELNLSILGLSETHHTRFPSNFDLREFSSTHSNSTHEGSSLIILDKSISIDP